MHPEPNRVVKMEKRLTLGSGNESEMWMVIYLNRECAPAFMSKGQAEVYLTDLVAGRRNPEWI